MLEPITMEIEESKPKVFFRGDKYISEINKSQNKLDIMIAKMKAEEENDKKNIFYPHRKFLMWAGILFNVAFFGFLVFSDWTLGIYLSLMGFIGVILMERYHVLHERLGELRRGIRYYKFVPILIIISVGLGYILTMLFGDTFMGFALWSGEGNAAGAVVASSASFSYLLGIVVYLILITVLLEVNYWEELLFRKKWWLVVLWAFFHFLMGIPLYAVIVIFVLGIFLKKIHDKYGLENAFAVHYFYNFTLFTIVMISILVI